MRVEQNVRPTDVPTEVREPEAPSEGNASTVVTPREERPFFPAPDLVATALAAGKIGVWAWDVAPNRITWSANLEEIHRLAAGSFDGTFSAFENAVHPDDRAGVVAAIKESLRSHKPHRTLYRLPPQPDGDERWIEASGTVVVENAQAVRMVGTCRDVTERVTLHRELRARASHQEAIARLGERALTESDLQKFFDEAVAMIADIVDVELVKILEVVPGDAELLLRSGVGWNPGLVGTAYVSTGRETQAGFTLASGGPVIVDNLAAETRFVGAPLLHDHQAVSGISTPIAGRDGRAYGVLTVHSRKRRKFSEYEVSFLSSLAAVIAGAIARLHQDRRQELMIRELRHRSGNLYSQLLALFSQTAKNSKNVADLTKKYAARVLALANAHRLITEGGWKSASLMELLNTLLAPHLDRITFAGPNVFLDPDATFGLSMAVHELASNASQHGSLSSRPGVVEVTWQVNRTERGLTLTFDWKEREGPAPKRTRRAGFGTRLISMVIERQLNGEVKQSFAPEGFDAQLVVPLTHERWPGGTVRSLAADNLT
jgi:PAS domain S-box-containing protein